MGKTIMRVRGLTKVFGSLTANDHIDLDIEAGRIHAIAGENGAGKSTLMKMLYGVYPATEGTIIVDETPVNGWNPALARENGVSMVFQDFRLIPAFTVLENVFLSLTGRRYVINRKDLRHRIRALSETYQLNVEPDQEVWKLDLGQRQHIEIIKALINPNTRMLIFDEPTSVLAPHEIARFLDMLLQFRADGYAVLLITHKIHEITTVADQITILRQGKKVCAINREDGFDQAAIIAGMLGEQTMEEAPEKPAAREFPQLPGIALRAVTVRDDHNREILQNVNMELARGRIMGIADRAKVIQQTVGGDLFRGHRRHIRKRPARADGSNFWRPENQRRASELWRGGHHPHQPRPAHPPRVPYGHGRSPPR